MKNQDLVKMMKSVSAKELKDLLSAKNKLDALEKRRKALEKDLVAVDKEMESLLGGPAAKKRTPRKKKPAQKPISALIVDILKAKKKPVSVNEICDILLKEKGYKTTSKKFSNQIRVLLYSNDKGLFKKAGPGAFKLA